MIRTAVLTLLLVGCATTPPQEATDGVVLMSTLMCSSQGGVKSTTTPEQSETNPNYYSSRFECQSGASGEMSFDITPDDPSISAPGDNGV